MRGQIAVAHNGNLTNAAKLRDELEQNGLVFQTTSDSEIIIMMLAQPILGGVENTLVQTLRRIEGAYSLIIMTEKELIGARDPFGFRPLALGRINGSWVLASESVAFDQIRAEFVRDVEPGGVRQVAVVGDGDLPAHAIHRERLRVADVRRAGGGITRVAYGHVTDEVVQNGWIKNLRHKPHAVMF